MLGAGLLVGVAVVVLGLVAGLQRRLVYFPSPGPVAPAAQVLPGARDLVLPTEDGLRLGAWLIPPSAPDRGVPDRGVPDRGVADRGVAVLVANGNAGDRAVRAPLARALAAEGLAVLLFDYRGYGGNAGTPSEDGLALDARAARAALLAETGLPPERLVVYGESLGAAVAARLAAEQPAGGLVLRSPFVSLPAVARVHYPYLPAGRLLRDRFPVAEHVARVSAPTVVVLGTRDGVVPPAQSRQVAAAAGGPVELVELSGADHDDPALLDGEALVRAVVALADEVARPG